MKKISSQNTGNKNLPQPSFDLSRQQRRQADWLQSTRHFLVSNLWSIKSFLFAFFVSASAQGSSSTTIEPPTTTTEPPTTTTTPPPTTTTTTQPPTTTTATQPPTTTTTTQPPTTTTTTQPPTTTTTTQPPPTTTLAPPPVPNTIPPLAPTPSPSLPLSISDSAKSAAIAVPTVVVVSLFAVLLGCYKYRNRKKDDNVHVSYWKQKDNINMPHFSLETDKSYCSFVPSLDEKSENFDQNKVYPGMFEKKELKAMDPDMEFHFHLDARKIDKALETLMSTTSIHWRNWGKPSLNSRDYYFNSAVLVLLLLKIGGLTRQNQNKVIKFLTERSVRDAMINFELGNSIGAFKKFSDTAAPNLTTDMVTELLDNTQTGTGFKCTFFSCCRKNTRNQVKVHTVSHTNVYQL